ncbi:MAG: phenylalanine--tRNA ligase subunit alpha, partial [Verrucomicrobiales bacterium]
MLEQLQTILSEATSEISKANTLDELNNLKVSLLGKKGRLTLTAAGMKDLSNEERPLAGKKLNETRSEITQNLEEKINSLQEIEDNKKVLSLDVTLPGNSTTLIGRHPISQMLDDSVKALRRMGFSLASGPEIETEWHCFDALNTPQDHPARNESDTFYFEDGNLLRTHTSTIQIRTMEKNHPPVRIIAPGAAYRRDEIDATHLSQFNQLEGLYVDQNVSLADLKGTLEFLLQSI